jgi:hypothetical protein
MFRLIAVACMLFLSIANAETLEEFLNRNNEIVIQYLDSLSNDQIGSILSGVALTDSTNPFKGYVFIGKNRSLQEGLSIYLLRSPEGSLDGYLWLTHGASFPLPTCEEAIVGKGAYVLSGDVYTWKNLQPGHGVVRTICPETNWINP